ncbi:hypothetical protein [Streptococcus suis]
MDRENELLKNSINNRLENERLELLEEKPKRKQFNIQVFIVLSIILGLLLTIIQAYFQLFDKFTG